MSPGGTSCTACAGVRCSRLTQHVSESVYDFPKNLSIISQKHPFSGSCGARNPYVLEYMPVTVLRTPPNKGTFERL